MCWALTKVLMQMDPNPSYSKALLSAIDSSKVLALNVASTAVSFEMLKKVESKIYLASAAVG